MARRWGAIFAGLALGLASRAVAAQPVQPYATIIPAPVAVQVLPGPAAVKISDGTLPPRMGRHDLGFTFIGRTYDPTPAIEQVRLISGTAP